MALKRRTFRLIIRVYIPLALLIGMVSALIWGGRQRINALRYEQQIDQSHSRAFHDLTDNFALMETALSKLTVSASKERRILLLSEVWRSAGECAVIIEQSPASYEGYRELSTFLSQISDYSRTLLERLNGGGDFEQDDKTQIEMLYMSTSELSAQLEQSRNGNYSTFSFENISTDLLSQYNSDAQSLYPRIIYDGPFSDSTARTTPRGLSQQTYDPVAAFEVARIFLGDQIDGELQQEEDQSGRIDTYVFSAQSFEQRKVEVAVTKQGGLPLWMRLYDNNDNVDDSKPKLISQSMPSAERQEELMNIGQSFLRSKGFDSMEARYMQVYSEKVLINYVYVQDGTLIYNDQIKLWIEIDNARIVGFDAENYLFSHQDRVIESAKLGLEEAKQKLSPNVEILQSARALIPVSVNEERYCYEFRCSYKDEEFLIYINASSGIEEDILKFVNSDAGRLLV